MKDMKTPLLKPHHRMMLAAAAAAMTGTLLLLSVRLTALDVASGSSGSVGGGTSVTEMLALVLIAISFLLFGVAWHLSGKHA